MTEVLSLALSFPSVVYTVLLGVVLVYWLFVVLGAISLGDGSADGALEGFHSEGAIAAAKGSLEGAAKGALQGHFEGMADAAGDVGDVGDGGELADGDGHDGSAVAALIHALHLRSVPATVILSLIVTFSWLVSTVGMQLVSRGMPAASHALLAWLLLAGSPVLALPLTSLSARPLAKLFRHRPGTSHADLIGKTCVVRTGTVTSTFGEASLEDGGAGLVLRVRVDRELPVKRGDQMLIVEWDRERESFLVEPLNEIDEIDEALRLDNDRL
ncbi:MAG TPA: glycine zipper family protein [Polyangiaceae bacterium]|nr:glycine zipper family protein [Polyangiaceae bacterium]